MKKRNLMMFLVVLLVLLLFSGCATQDSPGKSGDSGFNGLGMTQLIELVVDIGSLEALGLNTGQSKAVAFIRVILGVLIGFLIYLGISLIGLPNGAAIGISVLLAIVVTIFFPPSLILLFGETWAAVFAFILVFTPVAIGLYLILATPTHSRATAVVKIAAVLFMLWLVNELGSWAYKLSSTPGFISTIFRSMGL
ncbi:hypothetical protein HOC13_02080 [Candidatus Woesearchaeota archaeon]|nr:hypothetical protein [Candidatus Woesearchaeota archaeon]